MQSPPRVLALLFTLLAAPAFAEEAMPAPAAEDSAETAPAPNAPAATPPASPAVRVSTVEVVGSPELRDQIPGSAEVIERSTLETARVFTTSEALRKVSGINVRDEEGFSLRPNIGIRGLNPTRSSKVLLLEDGIPLSFAPYGDNASYYHPPVERFDRIEVLKGSGQIVHGPQTVGGVVNYITPDAPKTPGGALTLTGGNRGYLNGHAALGGTFGGTGLLLNYMHKQGEGARDNTFSALDDLNFKAAMALSERQKLTLRGNFYGETSRLTYSGLTQAEFEENPRQNPFVNDRFTANRWGASATHDFFVTDSVVLTTNFYGSMFQRDWWRQSSNSGQRPNDSSDPACGGMDNLSTTCGNEGRLRNYSSWGVSPVVRWSWALGSLGGELESGVRAHFETQQRRQFNGSFPTSRTAGSEDANAGIKEDNVRRNWAYSGFLQNRFTFGNFGVTPGLRVEHVQYYRENRLGAGGAGVSGRTDLTELVPGLGATWAPIPQLTLFGGVHRGFAPPRTEDIVLNAPDKEGNMLVDLDPERSWNYELGARARPTRGVTVEATAFRMDFENQIIPASVAGGVGATLTNAGATVHQGAEFSTRVDSGLLTGSEHNVWLQGAYTFLPVAEFAGDRLSNIKGHETESVSGKRIPYAPKNLLTASLGYSHPVGLSAMIEGVGIGSQFTDDLNSVEVSANGQRGKIGSAVVWNATVNWKFERLRTTVFATVKNVTDTLYIVDRTRGILPGAPRLVQAGLTHQF